ncbi:hypothetical protein [Streptomyces sp. NPDC048436]|uniref:hypothetical protein n=1 Tax=Streptomyces sp. NPDC048436 TaxID=3365550 RepID=UPI0037247758
MVPDLSVFGLHHPPCALDELERVTLPLGSLALGAGGAVLPEDPQKRLLESQREAGEEGEAAQGQRGPLCPCRA